MSKHTPGPWKLTEILIGDYDPDSANPDNREVSHCVTAESDDNSFITYALPNTMHGAMMANALLLAASPELLEACKVAMHQLSAAMHQLSAAIATAEGRTP